MENIVKTAIAEVVHEITPLKKLPKSDEALALLKKLALDTHRILKRHKWRIKTLKEFRPNNPSLLGMNTNRSVVSIRLRCASNQNEFIDYESLLHTMVHEITHMKHSNHSAEFYVLLDTLMVEVMEDQRRPVMGPGVRLAGDQIGIRDTNASLSALSKEEKRRRVADAAEKRLARSRLMGPPGGQRLGSGDAPAKLPTTRKELRRAMADAAQRRLDDAEWCPVESRDDASDQDTTNGQDDSDQVNVQERMMPRSTRWRRDERTNIPSSTMKKARSEGTGTIAAAPSTASQLSSSTLCLPVGTGSSVSGGALLSDSARAARGLKRQLVAVIDLVNDSCTDTEADPIVSGEQAHASDTIDLTRKTHV